MINCSFNRKLVATVIKDWDSPMDLSKTPPAPPMAAVHQRCVMILKELDEANSELTVEPGDNLHMYSNLFLSECSAVMFQQDSSLTVDITNYQLTWYHIHLNLVVDCSWKRCVL